MERLPQVYAARHGETAWSLSGQHTGRTDLPLTPRGETDAKQLGQRLRGIAFQQILTSPLLRARQTCALSGFGKDGEVVEDLAEVDYGRYEGQRTADILRTAPEWNLFRDGCPGGESIADIIARADRIVELLRGFQGATLLFTHMHFLRFLAARWIRLPAVEARRFALATASLSILGYEHSLGEPVIRLWNDDQHLMP
jgi:broad specificity phosphatase PhoE